MEKIRTFLDKTLEVLCSAVFVVMILTTLYQIFMRTVMNNPNTVTEEFVRFSLVWLSMLAMAYVVGKRSHLAVTLLSDNLSGPNKRLLEIVIQSLFLVFAALIMVYGGWKAVSVTTGQISPSLSLSMGYVYLSVPVSGFIMFVYSLLNLIQGKVAIENVDESGKFKMALQAGLILFFVFVVLLIVGMPIAISIAVSSIATLLMVVPFEIAVFTSAQKMVSSLNSFSLVAIPFFVLSGIIMNNGGIAEKLVNFAMLFVGRIPGGLAHTNVLGNALFGSMSSSAIAASTAIGGVLIPQQIKSGYDRKFATAVNIASAPTGMVIPPSTAFIMFSLVAGGASISSLFLGGYLVGALWSLAIMVVAYVHAKKHKYPTMKASEMGSAYKIIKEAIPSVMLIVIIIGGILTGIFTAIEASAIAVAYSLLIAMFFYKTVTVKDIYPMLKEAVLTTGTITFLLATSSMMSFAMAFTGIPQAISAAILGLTTNKFLILLLVNVVLLIVGMFMDVGPAILIFTPIFLPVITSVGVDPVHFGLFSIMNLCVGSITPPVGTGLYVGASVGGVKAEQMLKPLVPFYLAILAVLFLITYFPGLVMWLPNMAG